MKYTRRKFIGTSVAAMGAMLTANSIESIALPAANKYDPYEMVQIGKTSIRTTRLCMGTGIVAGGGNSNLTRLGFEPAVKLVRQIYEQGVRMFDTADPYGTHAILAEALKIYPRDSYVICTKVYLAARRGAERSDINEIFERFQKELQMEYIDILQFHYITAGNWITEMSDYMEAFDILKQKGHIRAHGFSSHSLDALKVAVNENWVDVCHTRINPFGPRMDDTPENVMPVIQQLHQAGKGIIGMKIFGEGSFADDPEKKNESLKYVLQSGNIDILDIGMDKMSDIVDTEDRIKQIDVIG